MKIIGIIPARFASKRLPGKPLLNIHGKPMIQHVYEQSIKSKLVNKVIVATDCTYIFNAIKHINGNVCMTSAEHENGTNRCIEVLKKLEEDIDYVVNIQGDEPYIQPAQIDELCKFISEKKTDIATQIKKEYNVELNDDKNIVKCIVNNNGDVINFTRDKVPLMEKYFYKHIGMYAFSKNTLLEIEQLQATANEIKYKLEQLRWLENGINIKAQTTTHHSKSIDTIRDLL